MIQCCFWARFPCLVVAVVSYGDSWCSYVFLPPLAMFWNTSISIFRWKHQYVCMNLCHISQYYLDFSIVGVLVWNSFFCHVFLFVCCCCCILAQCKCRVEGNAANWLYGCKHADRLAHSQFTLYPCNRGFMGSSTLVMSACDGPHIST